MASAAVDLLRAHPLVEEILDSHREHAAGPDHDYRDDKLAVAAAFHDIDVFSSQLPGDHVCVVRESIDVGIFFTRTVPRAIERHLIRHPLDPLPIVRARRALRETEHHDADR